MPELKHSVTIEMDEAMSNSYHKWLYIDAKQELSRYLTADLIANQRNMGDMDLAKMFHLTDPGWHTGPRLEQVADAGDSALSPPC